MLKLRIPQKEYYDENKEEFVSTDEVAITLEHSLISVSKWESKWCKPFLKEGEKSTEETLDYIKCMTITPNVKEEVYLALGNNELERIYTYIDEPQTATTVPKSKKGGYVQVITAELIYYWMISHNIPMECQKWHLNRLLMLIKVCNIKNAPPKKHSKNDILRRNAELNAQRKKQLKGGG